MSRILVTGASGFIGRHALDPLVAAGFEVHALSRKVRDDSRSGVMWHTADLLRPGVITPIVEEMRPTHLLHIAWVATPGSYREAVENLGWLTSSIELVKAFVRFGGKRIVGVGSCAEYDWRYGFCSELFTPCVPATLYGACKHALHWAASAFAAQNGVSMAWARVFFPYGPGEHPDRRVPYFVRTLLGGNSLHLSSEANVRRDFIFAEDVGRALGMLVSSAIEGTLNIASGEAVSLNQLAEVLARIVARPDLVTYDSERSGHLRDEAVVFGDSDRLREELRFTALTPLEDGLRKTIEWWRAQDSSPAS